MPAPADDPRTRSLPTDPPTTGTHTPDGTGTDPGPAAADPLARLSRLAAAYQEGCRRGAPPAAEDLCPDDPLLRQLLRHLIGAAAGPSATRSADSPGPAPGPEDTPAVPGYELHELLGAGGMGAVWKARHVRLNRVVALKVMLEGGRSDARNLIRFLAEAEAVAAVEHPHVVQVYDFGEVTGRPYMAMEYLEGGSLADRLRRDGRLPPGEAAGLVEKVARGVAAAHAAGIVHRDLKPGNVLLTAKGEAKVADFGLAKRGGSDLTQTGAVFGTPAYMAPEQAGGRAKFVTPAADVWALGVILYECLTGTRPFPGADAWAILHHVQASAPVPPGRAVAGVPRDLELICLKCLEKDPADRYPTAAELADDLARFAAGEPVSVRSAGAVERAARWARRKPGLARLAAALAASVVAGAVAATALAVWAVREADRADTALAQVRTEKDVTQAALDAQTLAQAQTREALDALTDDVVQTVFAKQPRLGPAERAFLQKVLGLYDRFTRDAGDAPAARAAQAAALARVGGIRQMLADGAGAEDAYRRAAGIYEQLPAAGPGPDDRRPPWPTCS